jgi:hypothetical protein
LRATLPPTQVAASTADSAALFSKRAMDIAKAPFSGLFMKAFMLYMVGSSIHVFTIFAVGTAVWQPIKAIIDTHAGDVSLL